MGFKTRISKTEGVKLKRRIENWVRLGEVGLIYSARLDEGYEIVVALETTSPLYNFLISLARRISSFLLVRSVISLPFPLFRSFFVRFYNIK